MCDKSRNTWLCVHWQWNTLEWCQLNALQASPVVHLVTPLSCVSLSMNTQPSVPAMETFSALLAIFTGIQRSPVNSPHKADLRLNDVNNREAGDLRRHRAHYDVIYLVLEHMALEWLLLPTIPRFVIHQYLCAIPLSQFNIQETFWDKFLHAVLLLYSCHYSDVIMSAMASQITCVTIVYSIGCWGADERKYQSLASLASDRWVPETRKLFPFDDVIMVVFPRGCIISGRGDANHYVQHGLVKCPQLEYRRRTSTWITVCNINGW